MSCKNCKKRVLNCHSTCSIYKDFKQKQEEIKEKQRDDKEFLSYKVVIGRKLALKRDKRLNLPLSNI